MAIVSDLYNDWISNNQHVDDLRISRFLPFIITIIGKISWGSSLLKRRGNFITCISLRSIGLPPH